MPAIRRLARSCAITFVTLGVSATTLAVAPAQAEASATRSGAVTLTEGQVTNLDQSLATRRENAASQVEGRILSAKQTALNQRGDAYSWGAVGPNAFDCSGLIFYSYSRAGFDVPRTSGAQADYTRRVAKQDMRPGDLMFFHDGGDIYHASIFIGYQDGAAMMVTPPGSGRQVTVTPAWTSSWFGGTLR